MVTRLAASVILAVVWCVRSNDGAAAFSAVHTTVSASRRTVLSLSENDSGTGSDVLELAQLGRRDALSRLAAAAAAAGFWKGGAARTVAAEQGSSIAQFSASPTSEVIGRMGYDGKLLPPPIPLPSPAEKQSARFSEEADASPKTDAEAFLATENAAPVKEMKDLNENEAGPIRASFADSDPPFLETLVRSVDPKLIPVGLVGGLALLNKDDFKEEGGEEAAPGFKKGGKKLPIPYGFDQGRNYWDGVDMPAARRAGLVIPPPPKTEEELAAEAAAKKRREKPQGQGPPPPPPSWALPKPTPYGVENEGRNPFIEDVLEYCEVGKITTPCTESIKGYLEDIAATGAVATSGETTAIVGYINSLDNAEGDGNAPGAAAAAFAGYLDALSAGSAPPPSSAKAVKRYLDTLNGTVAARASATVVANQLQQSPPIRPVVAAPGPNASELKTRLAGVEGRVAGLETKIDQIPDQVFQKVEAWQMRWEEQLTDGVKGVVQDMAPEQEVEETVAAVEKTDPPLAPEPKVMITTLEPVIVPASPFAGAIPSRPAVPGAGGAGPGNGYGLGSAAPWKTAAYSGSAPNPAATERQPVASAVPVPSDANVVAETADVSPDLESPGPLVGGIPVRPTMPLPSGNSTGGMKSYRLGSWVAK